MADTEYTLYIAEPEDVRAIYFEELVDRLRELKKKCNEPWEVEDFFRVLCAGEAFAGLLLNVNREVCGIVVFQVTSDVLTLERGIYVFATVIDRGHPRALQSLIKQWDEIAPHFEAQFVRFTTKRRGWEAIQKATTGWEQESFSWSKHYGR